MAEFGGFFFQTEWHLKRRQAQAPSWVWVHDFSQEACGQITDFDFGHLMIPNGGMAIRHMTRPGSGLISEHRMKSYHDAIFSLHYFVLSVA